MTSMTRHVAAVDLGATSGRVMLGTVGSDSVSLTPVTRFPNGPVVRSDGLHWDFAALRAHTIAGLAEIGRSADLASIGIDSWAVDYGLIRYGALVADPFHYRDERTAAGVRAVHGVLPFAGLHDRNGLQFLPFNTVYQLAADRDAGRLADVDRVLLIPDLLGYTFTGVEVAEATNASTTGLLRPDGCWDADLMGLLGLPASLLPPVVEPGTPVGPLLSYLAAETTVTAPLVTVASHDTASAVLATPMAGEGAVYISCGTWGLVGLETHEQIRSAAARDANFTNERGAFGTTRFLRNVMGLWLLNECITTWKTTGGVADVAALVAAAADVTGHVPLLDVDDPRFAAPGDMPTRIVAYCEERGLQPPTGRAAMARCIIESLAAAFVRTAREATAYAGRRIDTIHIVGGGALNALLCQRLADRAGLPVVAGPVEATALGNVLMQGCALGLVPPDSEAIRALVTRSMPLRRFTPTVGSIPDDSGAATSASNEIRGV